MEFFWTCFSKLLLSLSFSEEMSMRCNQPFIVASLNIIIINFIVYCHSSSLRGSVLGGGGKSKKLDRIIFFPSSPKERLQLAQQQFAKVVKTFFTPRKKNKLAIDDSVDIESIVRKCGRKSFSSSSFAWHWQHQQRRRDVLTIFINCSPRSLDFCRQLQDCHQNDGQRAFKLTFFLLVSMKNAATTSSSFYHLIRSFFLLLLCSLLDKHLRVS